MNKQIEIRYWRSKLPYVPYEHGAILPYSIETRNQIIDAVLNLGYSVMVRPMSKDTGWDCEGVLIWIDEGRFGQS